MKKLYFIAALITLTITTIFIYSCKKNDNRNDVGQCVIAGGFNTTVSYMFWVSKNYGGGTYTVQITDKNGNNLVIDEKTLSVFEATAPDACNTSDISYSKRARASLTYGSKYTWTAASSNRTFKGTIDVPCDGTVSCQSIQIDQ